MNPLNIFMLIKFSNEEIFYFLCVLFVTFQSLNSLYNIG